ncbi:Transcription factor [Penicillium griseofulvum]|uniref:Transcription factor n=1 Tax=Penicillium patulum TaxID=5078 RepID=A0A135LRF4_PENPA|nr:Transcription factor [Penicillium griseofulvum]KXG51511.1 Transcription factor [Penicillium griseofulvum]
MERLRRRRRPAFSCLECRRRKIKCDRKDPCSHCVSVAIQCVHKVFRDAPETSPVQSSMQGRTVVSSLDDTPSSRTQTRQSGTNRIVNEKGSVTSRPLVARADKSQSTPALTLAGQTEATIAQTPPTIHAEDEQPIVHALLQRIQHLEDSLATSPVPVHSESGGELIDRQPVHQNTRVSLYKTRTLRWSHWVSMANEFDLIVACYIAAGGGPPASYGNTDDDDKPNTFHGPEIESLLKEIGDLLRKSKVLAKHLKTGRPSKSLGGAGFDLRPPSRELADTMVDLYCTSFESVYRIIHVPSFRSEYQRYWDNPESATASQCLKILLVISIGSSIHDHGNATTGLRQKVQQWVHAAQAWLSGPLEKDRLDIGGLQVYCLVILARQIFSIGGDLVWVSMGSVIRMAMQIGLHHDPKHLPAMSLLQAELRRRLWATVLEMAIQSSLDSAMPPIISLDHFDTEAPSNYNDDEIDESTIELVPHPRSTYTTSSIQLILLDSMPTRLRILELLSGLKTDLSYQDALSLSSEVTESYCAYRKFSQENVNSGMSAFHRNLVDYFVRRFLIPLHCIFASKAQANPLFYYSLKVSLDVAMAIISPEPDDGFSRIMATGGGLFREGFWYATSVIGREILSQVSVQHREGTLYRNAQHRQLLKQTVRDMTSLAVARIHQGDTNVKIHMFLSMILAQTEATEEGVPCELMIAQGARDSLQFCHELLQTQVGTEPLPYYDDAGVTSSLLDGVPENSLWDFDLESFLPDLGIS